MSDYRPITCVAHEKLEYAVLKRRVLDLCYLDAEGVARCARGVPLDVYTRDRAEWLRFRAEDGQELTLRLDQIQSSEDA
ncbi:MAG: transcriptional antiterminator, Rof [Pseudomonadota bacterium]